MTANNNTQSPAIYTPKAVGMPAPQQREKQSIMSYRAGANQKLLRVLADEGALKISSHGSGQYSSQVAVVDLRYAQFVNKGNVCTVFINKPVTPNTPADQVGMVILARGYSPSVEIVEGGDAEIIGSAGSFSRTEGGMVALVAPAVKVIQMGYKGRRSSSSLVLFPWMDELGVWHALSYDPNNGNPEDAISNKVRSMASSHSLSGYDYGAEDGLAMNPSDPVGAWEKSIAVHGNRGNMEEFARAYHNQYRQSWAGEYGEYPDSISHIEGVCPQIISKATRDEQEAAKKDAKRLKVETTEEISARAAAYRADLTKVAKICEHAAENNTTPHKAGNLRNAAQLAKNGVTINKMPTPQRNAAIDACVWAASIQLLD